MNLRLFAYRIFAIAIMMGIDPVCGEVTQSSTIHVGDGSISGAFLQPYDNVWLVSVRYDDGHVEDRGLASDHVRFREIDGKKYLIRMEGTTTIGGKPGTQPASKFSSTLNVSDPGTLAPQAGEEYSSDNEHVLNQFEDHRVLVKIREKGGAADSESTIALPEPVYDFNGGMKGLLLASLPLRIGYRAILPTLGEKGFDTEEIRVVREQMVSAGHRGAMKTYVVETGTPPSQSTYWISKTVPYVNKVEIKGPHATASWDMIK